MSVLEELAGLEFANSFAEHSDQFWMDVSQCIASNTVDMFLLTRFGPEVFHRHLLLEAFCRLPCTLFIDRLFQGDFARLLVGKLLGCLDSFEVALRSIPDSFAPHHRISAVRLDAVRLIEKVVRFRAMCPLALAVVLKNMDEGGVLRREIELMQHGETETIRASAAYVIQLLLSTEEQTVQVWMNQQKELQVRSPCVMFVCCAALVD